MSMKLSESQIEFFEQPGLIVVVGKLHARFYELLSDEVRIGGEIDVKKDEYSDREGRFETRTGGTVLGGGGVLESDDTDEMARVGKLVRAELEGVVERLGARRVYMLMPDYMKGYVMDGLQQELAAVVDVVQFGNYLKTPLDEVLHLIQKAEGGEDAPPSDPEARKIWERGRAV